MEINEYIISIGGKASTLEALELGGDYRVTIDGTIISQTDVDNDNGTKNVVSKLKPRLVDSIEHKGKKLKIKDKSSSSKKTHGRHHFWEAEHPQENIPYDEAQELFRKHYDAIMAYVIKQKNAR